MAAPQFLYLQVNKRCNLRCRNCSFWEGAGFIRERMNHCNHYCGISHGVRREPSTLASRGRPQTSPPAP